MCACESKVNLERRKFHKKPNLKRTHTITHAKEEKIITTFKILRKSTALPTEKDFSAFKSFLQIGCSICFCVFDYFAVCVFSALQYKIKYNGQVSVRLVAA